MDLERTFVYLIWGVGTTVVWFIVMHEAWQSWRRYADRRSKREFLSRTAQFMVALCATVSIALVLWGEPGSNPRTFFLALTLGAFTGAGIVLLGARSDEIEQ